MTNIKLEAKEEQMKKLIDEKDAIRDKEVKKIVYAQNKKS